MDKLPYVGGLFVAAAIGWAVNFFAPGVIAAIARRPPVRIHIETDPAIYLAGQPNWDSFSFVVPHRLDQMGTPPSDVCREWWGWARSLGAADADVTQVRVVVIGLSETDVLIEGLQVLVLKRQDPLPGTHIVCPVGGAEGTPRQIEIELDGEPPLASYVAEGGELAKPFLFTLRKGEMEAFYLSARARESACQWVADLLVLVNGKRRIIRIDSHGQHFRTTPTTRAQTALWYSGKWTVPKTPDEPAR